ncbi:glycosyltransferase family 4 protein [Patescibacteria group bacterium]|nr:glycosyltransferase family 4 protein [Patescibacteria group bacterium]
MKILYDHQIFSAQVYGGISRYYVELIRNLKNDNLADVDLLILFTNNYYLLDAEFKYYLTLFPKCNFRGKKKIINIFNNLFSEQYLRYSKFDVFHPTYYNPYFLKFIGNKPFVLTVYDMIHEKFPEHFPKDKITTKRKRYLANRASKIIAISNNTKNDLIEIFNIPAEKINVIYLGYSQSKINNIDYNIMKLPKTFILFVGNRQEYKNFELFIKSVASILQKEREIHIVCIGGDKFTKSEANLFLLLNISNQLKQYNIPDSLLSYIYKKALFFIFPSLYEGFGLPILEAFASDCPVLCSNTSSLSEVAGDAAIYFDPYSVDSVIHSVKTAISSPELLNSLRIKAEKRLANFSWEKTAKETQKIYEMIV